MNFRHPIPRSGKPIKQRNPKRCKREFARTLHSKARQKFVQSLPCSACGVQGYSVNAHLLELSGLTSPGMNAKAREAASAKIAKIPFPLAQWIARVNREAIEDCAA